MNSDRRGCWPDPARRFGEWQRIWLLMIFLIPANVLLGQGNLTLSPGIGTRGSLVANLILSSPAGSQPAGIQWTLTFPPEEVVSITAVAEGSAIAAGKEIHCADAPGTYTCLLTGMNSTLIGDGVVAVLSVSLAPELTGTAFELVKTLGTSANGRNLGLTGIGGVVAVPPVLESLNCTIESLTAGGSSTCTVTLSTAAGGSVTLAGDAAALEVPASVSVPAASSSAAFPVTAGDIEADRTVSVTAYLNGSSLSAAIALATPPTVKSLVCEPSILAAGETGVCTVTLSKASGGTVVVAGNTAAVSLPASISVARGSTTGAFEVTAGEISTDQMVAVTASLNGSSQSASIGLNPAP